MREANPNLADNDGQVPLHQAGQPVRNFQVFRVYNKRGEMGCIKFESVGEALAKF